MTTQVELEQLYHRAKHYDLAYQKRTVDIPFYLKLCRELVPQGGSVLVFCGGTGRVEIPLARAGVENGYTVTVVDLSQSMLARFQHKLGLERREVQENVELIHGNMHNVNLKRTFDITLIPFSSFQHIRSQDGQLATLRNAYEHLDAGGHFLADIFCPNVHRLSEAIKTNAMDRELETEDPEEDIRLVRYVSGRSYDQVAQILKLWFVYKVYRSSTGVLIEEYEVPLELTMIFPREWLLLLKQVGFEVVEKWGDYQHTPFTEFEGKNGAKTPRMLFLCCKTT